MITSVSLIWSTYNQSNVFEFTLRALEAQTLVAFEIIVCDDGSKGEDRGRNLQLLEASHLDARYIWQPDEGFRLARSRNNAIRCARGQLLVFIDGDVVPPSTFMETHVAAHERTTKPTLVTGPRRWLDLRQAPIANPDLAKIFKAAASHGYDVEKQDQLDAVASSSPWLALRGFNFSVRRASEIEYDEAFEGWGKEDYDVACTLYGRFGYDFAFAPETEVVHLVSKTYSTTNPWFTADSGNIAAYIRNCIRFKRKHSALDVTGALWPLLHFELQGDTWLRREPVAGGSLADAIARAEAWCDRTPT